MDSLRNLFCASFIFVLLCSLALLCGDKAAAQAVPDQFNDAHFHLTNNVQNGPSMRTFLHVIGNRARRVAIFGVPVQQMWSYNVDHDRAPTYYLHSDAPLYYYSFTDAMIAMDYLSLSKEEQARFDPMITGFNPVDMYAVDHIRRVLQTFPGVFTGIGEFTVHKEFVSAKLSGPTASLENPALDRILEFAGEAGLVVLIHCDRDIPISSDDAVPAYLQEIKALFRKHPNAHIIWAHMGLGRLVGPHRDFFREMNEMLEDPSLRHVSFDLSWNEVDKYFTRDPKSLEQLADVIRRHPDRFLFGSDSVAPADQERYRQVFRDYRALWETLDAETSRQVRLTNYERLFDEARSKVRQWEKTQAGRKVGSLR